MSENKVLHECGEGWKRLIDPLVQECADLGGTVNQVKEKFGRLAFYYDPGYEAGLYDEHRWDCFEEKVDQAVEDSLRVCELCGAPGQLMRKAGWLKTLCAHDSEMLGYKERD